MFELFWSAFAIPFALMLLHERAAAIGRATIRAVTLLLPEAVRAEVAEQRLADLEDIEGGAWKLLYTVGVLWGCLWQAVGAAVAGATFGLRSYIARELRIYHLVLSIAGATFTLKTSDYIHLRQHMLEIIAHLYEVGAMSPGLKARDRKALVKGAVTSCLLGRENPVVGQQWAALRERVSKDILIENSWHAKILKRICKL